MFFQLRRDGDLLAGQEDRDPFRRPSALGGLVDPRQRLQRHRLGHIAAKGLAEVVPVAAHGQRRGANRAAEVEGENLGFRIAPKLQRHQRQQHRLAGPGRTHHQGVADIADVQGEAERR